MSLFAYLFSWELAAGLLALYALWAIFVRAKRLPGGGPTPPIISGWVPWLGCGVQFLRGPRALLERLIREVGPTFILDMFGMRLFFVFSPVGLKSLYKVREADASFTEATRGLLSLKLPAEVLEGGMTQFHQGLRRPLVQNYVKRINEVVKSSIAELGERGEFEIFTHMKQVLHKMSVLCWVGKEALDPRFFGPITEAFETLDPEAGFSNPMAFVRTLLTFRFSEKRALDRLERVLKQMWTERQAKLGGRQIDDDDDDELNDNLTSLHRLFANLDEAARYRKVAVSVFQFHLASLINLYAAVSWTMINVLTQGTKKRADGSVERPYLERILAEREALVRQYDADYTYSLEALDEGLYSMERIAQESLRLAQQSITLRKVLRPTEFEDESHKYWVPAPVYLATLISITNVTEPQLGSGVSAESSGVTPMNEFDPDRYERTKLAVDRYLPASVQNNADAKAAAETFSYSISTFGHGSHACPGLPFAMYAFKVIFSRYLSSLELTPQFEHAEVPPNSIGAIARATHPCVVEYRVKRVNGAK